MNKQKFIELLNNPGDLKEVNLNELDDLVADNPYFQAARVLEAKGHRLHKTKVAGRKTASAAIYSTNRILLKNYLAEDGLHVEKPVVSQPTPIQEKPKPATKAPEPITKAPEPASKPAETKIEQAAPATPQPTEPAIQQEPTGSSSIDQLIYNLNKDMEELEKSRAKYIEVSRKIEEEEAVEKAVKKATRSTEKAKASPKVEPTKTSKASDTAPKAKSPGKTTSTKSTTASKAKTSTEKKSTTTKKTTTKTSTKSASKPKANTAKKATKTAARKASPRATTKKSTSKTSKTTKSDKKDDHDGENQQHLINEFIKSNPSFRPAKETGEQQDLSTQSTSLPDDVATEYLAEIFLQQGKKDKALKIYNSLMLRFPEKKAYFAGRIKKIK